MGDDQDGLDLTRHQVDYAWFFARCALATCTFVVIVLLSPRPFNFDSFVGRIFEFAILPLWFFIPLPMILFRGSTLLLVSSIIVSVAALLLVSLILLLNGHLSDFKLAIAASYGTFVFSAFIVSVTEDESGVRSCLLAWLCISFVMSWFAPGVQ